MANKYFNVKTGLSTGNITLDANSSNINANNLTLTGNVSAVDLNLSGNLTSNLNPNANVTLNLGNTAARFNNAYVANLNAANTVVVGSQTLSANTAGLILSSNLFADTATLSNLNLTNQLNIISTTQSTSTDTGSITTSGGVGIKKDLYVGGAIHLANNNGGIASKAYVAYNDMVSGIEFNFNI
jgi:hypothetical protein